MMTNVVFNTISIFECLRKYSSLQQNKIIYTIVFISTTSSMATSYCFHNFLCYFLSECFSPGNILGIFLSCGRMECLSEWISVTSIQNTSVRTKIHGETQLSKSSRIKLPKSIK